LLLTVLRFKEREREREREGERGKKEVGSIVLAYINDLLPSPCSMCYKWMP
jgi:hypothetical protein